jgi:hypothetical protein
MLEVATVVWEPISPGVMVRASDLARKEIRRSRLTCPHVAWPLKWLSSHAHSSASQQAKRACACLPMSL